MNKIFFLSLFILLSTTLYPSTDQISHSPNQMDIHQSDMASDEMRYLTMYAMALTALEGEQQTGISTLLHYVEELAMYNSTTHEDEFAAWNDAIQDLLNRGPSRYEPVGVAVY